MFNTIPWSSQQNNTNITFANTDNTKLDLNGFLSQISSLLQNENGKSLSRLLSFRQLSKADILGNTSSQNLSRSCQNILSNCKPWNAIIWHHLQSILHSLNNKFKQAWQSSLSSLKIIQSKVIIHNNNNNNNNNHNIWYLSIINVIFKNITECAIIWYNNKELEANDIINDTVGGYFQIIRVMASDTNININANKVTLSHGLFFTVNQIIKLCDIINNEIMANNALSVVEKFRSILTCFPLSDVVTHLYFMGRYNLQRGGTYLYKAKQDLQYAYNLCTNNCVNKSRILLLLIPIQIMNGYLPNLNKLPQCLYDRFYPIIYAVKTGNILLFKKAMNFYENDFINCGIYLLLMKLEILVYRSLVCKIYVLQKKMTQIVPKPHIVKLNEIKKGIQIRNKQYYQSEFTGMFEGKKEEKKVDFDEVLINEIDEDEIECILSTLIYKKLIGGYVAHKTACCLSKIMNKAFPPVRTCKDWWINDF